MSSSPSRLSELEEKEFDLLSKMLTGTSLNRNVNAAFKIKC
jgi:hypothetical protein